MYLFHPSSSTLLNLFSDLVQLYLTSMKHWVRIQNKCTVGRIMHQFCQCTQKYNIMSLCCCVAVSLCHCVAVSLCCGVIVLLCHCVIVLRCHRVVVSSDRMHNLIFEYIKTTDNTF